MKAKKFVPLLVFVFLISTLLFTACGAPASDTPPEVEIVEVPVTVVVHSDPQIVEVEKVVEVTAAPPEPTAIVEWGILYLEVTHHTTLWQLVGETDDGVLLFERFSPYVEYDAGAIILAYNGLGDEEFYLNEDGDLALAGPDWPNGQDLYFDDDGNSVPTFIGRWSGLWIDVEGNLRANTRYFYKVAGPIGPGLYVLAEDVSIPLCENLMLSYPESCSQ